MANLQRAIEIAVTAHKAQLQKNGLPYVLHPLTLMFGVDALEAKMAAVLHDVVEDTAWTLDELKEEGFPKDVIDAVAYLTHDASLSYESYIEQIATNDLARVVKLADLTDNMNTLRIPELQEKDFERLSKYHKAWRKLRDVSG